MKKNEGMKEVYKEEVKLLVQTLTRLFMLGGVLEIHPRKILGGIVEIVYRVYASVTLLHKGTLDIEKIAERAVRDFSFEKDKVKILKKEGKE